MRITPPSGVSWNMNRARSDPAASRRRTASPLGSAANSAIAAAEKPAGLFHVDVSIVALRARCALTNCSTFSGWKCGCSSGKLASKSASCFLRASSTSSAERRAERTITMMLRTTQITTRSPRPPKTYVIRSSGTYPPFARAERLQPFLEPGLHGLQRLRQRVGIHPARLRHVGTPAAFAPHLLSDEVHELPRLDAAGQILGHARDERDLAVIHRREQRDAAPEAVAHLVQRVPKHAGIGAIERDGDCLHALDRQRAAREQLVETPECDLALETRHFLLQRLHALDDLRDPGFDFLGLRAQRLGDAGKPVRLRPRVGNRDRSRDRLDPPDPCRHSTFRDDSK